MSENEGRRLAMMHDSQEAFYEYVLEHPDQFNQVEAWDEAEAWSDKLVTAAEAFAEQAHAGQYRKDHVTPYIVHPERVADTVRYVQGVTPSMVAAAWLHDVVEDCDVTLETIEAAFGPMVAEYVGWVTNPSKGSKENRRVRKRMDREHLAKAPWKAKVIKLADRIDNLRDIVTEAPGFTKLYRMESRQLHSEALLGVDKKLEWELQREYERE
jgi:(p)ppGpp synthase/HD superfamily hydrolase